MRSLAALKFADPRLAWQALTGPELTSIGQWLLAAWLASTATAMLSAQEQQTAAAKPAAGAPILSDLCCGDDTAAAGAAAHADPTVLRISADPNNLPFTNDKQEGFENRIAELVARDLGLKLEYKWRAQRRGFFRSALTERECDLVLGAPKGFDRALTTRPYYRSSYAFVSRKDRELNIRSLTDPRLAKLRIGVPIAGDDGVNPPPAHALAHLGIIDNVVGFTLYGNYEKPNPPAEVVKAAAEGTIDVAICWGPLAGYFASRQPVEMEVIPVPDDESFAPLRFSYSIAMGVRKGNTKLRDKIDTVLARRADEIQTILRDYHVPLVEAQSAGGR